MGDFHKAFYAIDESGSGSISVDELQHYMVKNNYKPTFVTKWLNLFDVDKSGIITYKQYCETLGLVPKRRESEANGNDVAKFDTPMTESAKSNIIEKSNAPETFDTTYEIKSELVRNGEVPMDVTVESSTPDLPFVDHKSIPEDNTHESTKLSTTNTVEGKPMEVTIEVQQPTVKAFDKSDKKRKFNSVPFIIKAGKPNNDKGETMETIVDIKQSKKVTSVVNESHKKQSVIIAKDRLPKIVKVAETKTNEEVIMKTVVEKKESNEAPSNTNIIQQKGRNPKSYPVQTTQKGREHRGKLFSQHKRRLRASIQPGVVMILLAGRHKGKRVVFLRALNSGLLLVTGPLKLNGCPLRRVHQQMVIATKTKIDISDVQVPDHINDDFFARNKEERGEEKRRQMSADVSSIFAKTRKQYVLNEERKRDQKVVDRQVLAAIKRREDKKTMAKYLKTLFSLSSHDCPHKMEF